MPPLVEIGLTDLPKSVGGHVRPPLATDLHKDRIFQKNVLENKEMDFKYTIRGF